MKQSTAEAFASDVVEAVLFAPSRGWEVAASCFLNRFFLLLTQQSHS